MADAPLQHPSSATKLMNGSIWLVSRILASRSGQYV
jgi:hypothetical protein